MEKVILNAALYIKYNGEFITFAKDQKGQTLDSVQKKWNQVINDYYLVSEYMPDDQILNAEMLANTLGALNYV